jgi:hypothetical protein
MCEPYKQFSDLQADNPKGLEPLGNPHGFSSNPGFFGPAARPATRSQQSVVPSGNTMGRSAIHSPGSINPASPGSLDPTSDGSPMGVTSGFGG